LKLFSIKSKEIIWAFSPENLTYLKEHGDLNRRAPNNMHGSMKEQPLK
jgi:hypothetical protein